MSILVTKCIVFLLLQRITLTLSSACTLEPSNDNWPACVKKGVDWTGDDLLDGLRFSKEACAEWCESNGARCVGWVYKDKGSWCHLKYIKGRERNMNNPLTTDEIKQVEEDCQKNPPAAPAASSSSSSSSSTNGTSSNTTSSSSSSTSTATSPCDYSANDTWVETDLEKKLKVKRQKELETTYYGDNTCIPPKRIYWPNCVVEDKKLTGGVVIGTPEKVADYDTCSTNCFNNDCCHYWSFNSRYQCTMMQKNESSAPILEIDELYVYYGHRDCFGKVPEAKPADKEELNGAWSPWSTLQSPCFKLKTGREVDCGGGVQYRYRSCTNPVPRFGGRKCPGLDYEETPCNTHACALPAEFLWSEWGLPDKLCDVGTQKRTTMCGSLRRRLPNKVGRDSDDPAVYWPTCLISQANEAESNDASEHQRAQDATTLEMCMQGCKEVPLDKCTYWTWFKTNSTCIFRGLLKVTGKDTDSMDAVTGEKYCTGDIFMPHCTKVNMEIPGTVTNISEAKSVKTMDECYDMCVANGTTCGGWLLSVDNTDQTKMECMLYGDVPTATVWTHLTGDTGNMTTYFATSDCVKSTSRQPAMAEDAEELSYIEICKKNQYKEEFKQNNTWDLDYCPSPCEALPCPDGAACNDTSNSTHPQYECNCQMGLVEEGGRCIVPPPTTPTPRPIPEMDENEKMLADGVTRTACFVLIGCLIVTFLIFAIFRIINHGRFIHMNIEISLLFAHVCLLTDFVGDEVWCRNISILIHFFFTVVFAFFMLEGIYMYSLLANIVTRNGMLSYMGNFLCGWGIGVCVIAFTVSFEYEDYGGDYTCWLQIDRAIMLGQYTPIALMVIITIMLIEAAGSVDESTMKSLPHTDDVQKTSAKYMHRTLILRLILVFVSFILGTMAEYEQSFMLFLVFTVINGVTGGVIFLAHCFSNDVIRAMLVKCFRKCCPKKKQETDVDVLIEKENEA